ncbi:LysR family transcriptional regulator [Hoeflea marina]|uniref:LysR family transcriptional regulator n=1 Tax=Hoeflea marina TaxID=274592 RepID=A0A317PXC6_9HYPH|nr:LysR family transcriptional regulator [Hoeflea marina]PWW04150.1 LysR family transcriptional regulator [Hoeflea marina]
MTTRFPQMRGDLMQRGVKLAHLRLMAQLAETNQISAAAAAMNISQPAASRLAAELEKITGVELYVRNPRGVELTEQGRRLAARAQSMVQGLRDAGRELVELGEGQAGSVTIGSVSGAAIELVLPSIKRMRVTNPGVETTVNVDISDVLAKDLLANRLDFYIGRVPAQSDRRLFSVSVIGEEPMVLVVRRDHPLAHASHVTLSDCVGYDWVMQGQGGLLRRTVDDYLIAQGLPLPQKVLNTASVLLTLATVMETNAIAPMARAVAEIFGGDRGFDGRTVALAVAPDLAVSPFALVRRAHDELSPAARTFHAYLADLGRAYAARLAGKSG